MNSLLWWEGGWGGQALLCRALSSPASPESYSLAFALPWAAIGHITNAVWCQHSVHSFPTLTESPVNYYHLLIMLRRNTSFINTIFNHSGLQSSTALDHSKQLAGWCLPLDLADTYFGQIKTTAIFWKLLGSKNIAEESFKPPSFLPYRTRSFKWIPFRMIICIMHCTKIWGFFTVGYSLHKPMFVIKWEKKGAEIL